MKKAFILFLLLSSLYSVSQSVINVMENTFKVSGLGSEEFYYAFAEGDQIIFDFEEVNGKELKEVEILEYPGISKYMDYKSKKIKAKSLSVATTGIYVFRFNNNALGGRVCKCKIDRIPKSEATQKFNTNVYWQTQRDTTYRTTNERYLIKRAYVPITVVSTTEYFINSGRNSLLQGGKSRITFPVSLPKNTVEWYYQFSAFRDEKKMESIKGLFNLAGNLTRVIDQTGTLDFAIDKLTQPPGADFCDIYLLDFDNSRLFEAKVPYQHYVIGSRENIKSGIVRINKGIGSEPYLGIKNPDSGYGINVIIEVVAIVLEEEWGMKEVKHPIIISRQIPYFQ